jgi:hypothetical protein
MFRPGTILNDTWEVKRRIGQGSFCELFLARNIVDRDAPMVAVKAQNSDIEASIIRVLFRFVKCVDHLRNFMFVTGVHLIGVIICRWKVMSYDLSTTSHQYRSSIS